MSMSTPGLASSLRSPGGQPNNPSPPVAPGAPPRHRRRDLRGRGGGAKGGGPSRAWLGPDPPERDQNTSLKGSKDPEQGRRRRESRGSSTIRGRTSRRLGTFFGILLSNIAVAAILIFHVDRLPTAQDTIHPRPREHPATSATAPEAHRTEPPQPGTQERGGNPATRSRFQCRGGERSRRADSTACESPRPGEIVVRGERHSGTHWVVDIIKRNLRGKRNKVENDPNRRGWKHGFLPPLGTGRTFKDDVRVFLTRDVFTWLPKMKQDVYEPMMDPKRKLNFSDFIRSEYGCICMPIGDPQCLKHNKGNYKRYENPKNRKNVSYDRVPDDVLPFERADNIVQIRTLKYKQWLKAGNATDHRAREDSREIFAQNTLHVRLESLTPGYDDLNGNCTSRELQNKFIGQQLRDRCISVADDANFQGIGAYVKWGGGKGKMYDTNKEQGEMLDFYSESDVRFVLAQLDLDFERSLGYDYGYVHKLLEQGHFSKG